MGQSQETAQVLAILEAHRGGVVHLHFKDGEQTTSQILFVDDHLWISFCHRIIRTNREDKRDGAYQPNTSWIASLEDVLRVEVAEESQPWGPEPGREVGGPHGPNA
ncbi:MAG: hypothetical protein ACYTGX_05090 [Planctomycetota bacterium]|jgi:hypothetical protein